MNNLVGGLITEVGALNFPPGGATATENCIWTQKKTVKRRLGFNFEADFTPQPVSPLPVPPDTRQWSDSGMSENGSRVILTDGNDIFLSLDSGVTFHNAVNGGQPHGGIGGVDISADGSTIAACSFSSRAVYSSIDFGATWQNISQGRVDNKNWQDLSFSLVGSPILVATETTSFKNYIYNFSGDLWTDKGVTGLSVIGDRVYFSAEGPFILGATFTDLAIYSSDSGTTWLTSTENPSHISAWGALSADGSKMFYIGEGNIGNKWLTSSVDAGTTWVVQEPLSFAPQGICCDYTGSILYAGDFGDPMGTGLGNTWKSIDHGLSWSRLASSPFVAGSIPICSQDGAIVVTIAFGQGAWYSHDAGDTWAQSAVL